ncbi:MAG: FecR family protein [Planctomycetes bacterium]|nr:FecR family protein [Planctomycetota bacterium]
MKINPAGGTLSVAMALWIAVAVPFAWADDMTKPVALVQDDVKTDAVALQAIFMDVTGKVRWRASETAPWTDAKVNDILDAGAEIRTGLKSQATMRVGKNATILVDSGTTCKLPVMVQDGQTLRTLASVKSGRADFKVDHVGFANDFKVVTPQTTLSVRGTGFSVSSGPLKGVDISGARTNTMNAVEVKYVAANLPYFVSGQGKTSSENGKRDPVQNAWVSTVGPPAIAGTMVSQSDVQQQVAQGSAGVNPSSNTQQIQQTQAGEASEDAIDTAIVLSSVNGGGGESSNVYLRFQNDARDTKDHTGETLQKNLQNEALSNAQLASFNQNFATYENGQWESSLTNLHTLWDGQASGGFTPGGSGGVNLQLMNMQSMAASDLLQSSTNLEAMSFDSSHYFVNEIGDSSNQSNLTNVAFQDGALLNGSGESLLTLQQRWREDGALLQQAGGLNAGVQTAFGQVSASYAKLLNAEQALNGLGASGAVAQGYAASLNSDLNRMNKFLADLKALVGKSTSTQSQDAIAGVSSLASVAAGNVANGLMATKNALDNYKNASSRGTQAMFLAEAARYRDAVAISIQSIAYLTQASESGGAEGIAVLAAKMQNNFNDANGQFSYKSFQDYAQTHVDHVGLQSGQIQNLAGLAQQSANDAENELATGSANYMAINAQLATMLTQVNLMESKNGVADAQGNFAVGTLGNFQAQSVTDMNSSNAFKASFDQLFADGASQSGLNHDLSQLQILNDLYQGSNSIPNQAEDVYSQIAGHYDNVLTANASINGLTANYNSKLQDAESKSAQSQQSYLQNFADSKAGATRYLNDFKTIVGANNTEIAKNALAAVTQLVDEHNTYVDNAAAAVAGAINASQHARSRGDMVYYNAVAQRMEKAASIQMAADASRLSILTNGSVIRENYNQANSDYHSLDSGKSTDAMPGGGASGGSGAGGSGSTSGSSNGAN